MFILQGQCSCWTQKFTCVRNPSNWISQESVLWFSCFLKREDEFMFKSYLIQRAGYLACQLSTLDLDERIWSLNKLWLSSFWVLFLFFSFCDLRFGNRNLNSFVLVVGAGVAFLSLSVMVRMATFHSQDIMLEGTLGVYWGDNRCWRRDQLILMRWLYLMEPRTLIL